MVNAPRLLIIINKAAAKARRAWPIIHTHLNTAGIHFDSYETTAPGDATVRTRVALRAGINTIAVVGGDGTLSEAAEGFFEFSNDTKTPAFGDQSPGRPWQFYPPAPGTILPVV